MRKFLIRSILFVLFIFLIGRVISLFVPYHWGNPWYSSKIQYLEQINKEKLPNVFFFGSSRIYRNINPYFFDIEFEKNSVEKISSFNLGAPATFCPQSYYLYEQFLDSELSSNADIVFLELLEISSIGTALMHQERTTYWQNYRDLLFVLKSVFRSKERGILGKVRITVKYSISYFENIFNIGQFKSPLLDKNFYDPRYVGKEKNGFFPLDADLRSTTDSTVKENLLERKNSLKEEEPELKNRALKSIEFFKSDKKSLNKVHFERIEKLIKKAKKNNIQLIFIITPNIVSPSIVKLFNAIPAGNKIQLADANDFPEFYQTENLFDVGHLNEKGAELFSKTLARESLKQLLE